MAISTYLANKILALTLNGTAYTPPTNVYLALAEEDFTAAGTGTELTGGSYVRKLTSWFVPSAAATTNILAVTFTALPASEITHGSLWDAVSGGNMLYYGAFDDALSVAAGDDLTFDASTLDHTLL
jgi:hypothetical protein